MQPWTMMLLTGMLYLFVGVPAGMTLRFARWAQKQPAERRKLSIWWIDRMGANLTALILGLLGAGFVVEGKLISKIPWAGSTSGFVLAPPIGAAVTYGSHWIMAWGKKRAEARIGGPVPPEEEV